MYDARPYVCRTQGLPLAWVEEQDGAWGEHRDICALNQTKPELVQLPSRDVWLRGPHEGELAQLNGSHERVTLRSLFEHVGD